MPSLPATHSPTVLLLPYRPTTAVVTFDEILAGAAGPKEAAAARQWVAAGAPVQPLPTDLVALDPDGLDMRVANNPPKGKPAAAQPHPHQNRGALGAWGAPAPVRAWLWRAGLISLRPCCS